MAPPPSHTAPPAARQSPPRFEARIESSQGTVTANQLPILDSGRDRKSQEATGLLRKWDRHRPGQIVVARPRQEESGCCAYDLKTVVRKDLWVRVPRPPQ
jgi:hypothetical protein